MKQRITISISSEIIKKVRIIQANLIPKSTHSISFSSVLENLLIEALKKK